MRQRWIALATLTVLGCSKGADQPPAASPAASNPAERIDRVLTTLRGPVEVVGGANPRWTLAERMAALHIPGVSIAVIDSGRVVWARGFGVKAAGGTDSVTPRTLFQAASISKPVTQTGMLRLVEQGKLKLDENVNTYLKSWKVPDNKFTAKEKVTLRRIASHSAGLTVHGFPGYETSKPLPTVPQILDGTKPANTAAVRVDTFPGARWSYSGGGTTMAQLIMTDVTGEPFPELMRRLVLEPAGMTHSTYEQPLPPARASEAAHGHLQDGTEIPGGWHVYPEMGPAGLWTTPTDLAHWLLELAADRAGTSTKLLSQATAKEMLTVQSGGVGIGPFLEKSGRAFRFGHGGDNAGFHSEAWMFPETGQGAVVVTNGDNGQALIAEILYAVGAEYGWPDYGPLAVTPVTLDSGAARQAVGDYKVTYEKQTLKAAIAARGDTLYVTSTFDKEPERLIPQSPTDFVGMRLGYRYILTTSDGKVSGIRIKIGDAFELVGKKVK
ncbi:MAG: serine hydrolase domain-containing protein [Gemmatimonadota bacterium]